MTYKEIFQDIKEKTNNFKDLHGAYDVSSKNDLSVAFDILSKVYSEVKKVGLNYSNKAEDGLNYEIIFSNPILDNKLGEELMRQKNEGLTPRDREVLSTEVRKTMSNEELKDVVMQVLPADKRLGYKLMRIFNSEDDFDDRREEIADFLFKRKYTLDLENDLDEAIEKHDQLNPDLWDENNELKPEVKEKLEEIVDHFDKALKDDGVELDVMDICIIGSNASYNYNPTSDIDLHVVANTGVYDNEDLALKIYQAYKSLFNNKYMPTIRGHEVEIYVEPYEIRANSKGIYSLKNGWLKEPENTEIPDINQLDVDAELQPYIDRFDDIIIDGTVEDINSLIDDIYLERQSSILKDGEFAIPNLMFKEFRANGYLQKLRDRKVELENKAMSINDSVNPDLIEMFLNNKPLPEELIEYNNGGVEFRFPEIEDTLAVYLQWEGIYGFDQLILDNKDLFEDDLEELLSYEGIIGYARKIKEILDGEACFCWDMEMSDFRNICNSLDLNPEEAELFDGETITEDCATKEDYNLNIINLRDGKETVENVDKVVDSDLAAALDKDIDGLWAEKDFDIILDEDKKFTRDDIKDFVLVALSSGRKGSKKDLSIEKVSSRGDFRIDTWGPSNERQVERYLPEVVATSNNREELLNIAKDLIKKNKELYRLHYATMIDYLYRLNGRPATEKEKKQFEKELYEDLNEDSLDDVGIEKTRAKVLSSKKPDTVFNVDGQEVRGKDLLQFFDPLDLLIHNKYNKIIDRIPYSSKKGLKEAWDYQSDYANYSWQHPEVDIEAMMIKDGKDKKFINGVFELLDEFAAEDYMNEPFYESHPLGIENTKGRKSENIIAEIVNKANKKKLDAAKILADELKHGLLKDSNEFTIEGIKYIRAGGGWDAYDAETDRHIFKAAGSIGIARDIVNDLDKNSLYENVDNSSIGKSVFMLDGSRHRFGGIITKIENGLVYLNDETNPKNYQLYTIKEDKFNKYLEQGLYKLRKSKHRLTDEEGREYRIDEDKDGKVYTQLDNRAARIVDFLTTKVDNVKSNYTADELPNGEQELSNDIVVNFTKNGSNYELYLFEDGSTSIDGDNIDLYFKPNEYKECINELKKIVNVNITEAKDKIYEAYDLKDLKTDDEFENLKGKKITFVKQVPYGYIDDFDDKKLLKKLKVFKNGRVDIPAGYKTKVRKVHLTDWNPELETVEGLIFSLVDLINLKDGTILVEKIAKKDNKFNITEAKDKKVYTVVIDGPRRSRTTSGTLEELIDYFGYTLEKGYSWQHEKGRHKINRNPKTIDSLIDNLNWASDNAAANGYSDTSYYLDEGLSNKDKEDEKENNDYLSKEEKEILKGLPHLKFDGDLDESANKNLKEDLNKEYIIINNVNDVKKYSKQFIQLLKEAIIEDEKNTMIDKFNDTWNKDDDDFEEAHEWLQQKLAGITENNYKWTFSTYDYTDAVEVSLKGEYQHIARNGKNKGKYILDGGSVVAYVDVEYGRKYTFKELKQMVDFN